MHTDIVGVVVRINIIIIVIVIGYLLPYQQLYHGQYLLVISIVVLIVDSRYRS